MAGNVLNAALNYAWIFGESGFPALGVFGSAWATTVSRWFMVSLMLGIGWPHLSPYLTRLGSRVFAPRALLRGLGDTRLPVVASIVGFWCLGIPASLWRAFGEGLGAEGLWWGLVVGLAIVALFLILRLKHHEHRELVRMVVD